MRIGKVIGTVTLSRSHPSLAGASYRMVVPLSLDNLLAGRRPMPNRWWFTTNWEPDTTT